MSKLADVVYGSQEQLDSLFNGQTVSGHTYNENDLYIEELGDDIELGATGSGTKINNQNQLTTIFPECPSTTDGTFVLKATVSSGTVTYSWVAE